MEPKFFCVKLNFNNNIVKHVLHAYKNIKITRIIDF